MQLLCVVVGLADTAAMEGDNWAQIGLFFFLSVHLCKTVHLEEMEWGVIRVSLSFKRCFGLLVVWVKRLINGVIFGAISLRRSYLRFFLETKWL